MKTEGDGGDTGRQLETGGGGGGGDGRQNQRELLGQLSWYVKLEIREACSVVGLV